MRSLTLMLFLSLFIVFRTAAAGGENLLVGEYTAVETSTECCIDTDQDGFEDSWDLCPTEFAAGSADGCPVVDSDSDGLTDDIDSCPWEHGNGTANGCPLADSDADGFTDNIDACPWEHGNGTSDGCPVWDSDGDGLIDRIDACIWEHGNGTADGCPVWDSDGDGLIDSVDTCPGEHGTANGCPIADSDADGLTDDIDACPWEHGNGASNGCPIWDNDGDGLNDDIDVCPLEDGFGSADGCPSYDELLDEDQLQVVEFVSSCAGCTNTDCEQAALEDSADPNPLAAAQQLQPPSPADYRLYLTNWVTNNNSLTAAQLTALDRGLCTLLNLNPNQDNQLSVYSYRPTANAQPTPFFGSRFYVGTPSNVLMPASATNAIRTLHVINSQNWTRERTINNIRFIGRIAVAPNGDAGSHSMIGIGQADAQIGDIYVPAVTINLHPFTSHISSISVAPPNALRAELSRSITVAPPATPGGTPRVTLGTWRYRYIRSPLFENATPWHDLQQVWVTNNRAWPAN